MLTDQQVKRLKGAEKPYKVTDGEGLFILVAPSGSRSWRLKYRFAGKEKLLTIGRYPDVTISAARGSRDEAKACLRAGRDPAMEKRKAAALARHDADNSFEAVARAWFDVNRPRWTTVHAGNVIGSLETDVFPALGSVPIREITPALVLSTLRPIEARGAIETAKRIRQRMSMVFVYAIASGLGEADPAAIVKGALRPLPKKGRQPALTDLADLRTMLADVEAQNAGPVVKLAHRFQALTSVRPGEAWGAQWTEFEGIDWNAEAHGPHRALWRIPAERMKLRLDKKDEVAHDHLVPLSEPAVDILRTIRALTGRAPYVFPNDRSSHRPVSENAVGYLINRAGYHGRHVPHGWRAAFSTVMNEWATEHGRVGDRQVIDAMLAHVPKEKIEAAYNRAGHHARRRELSAIWAALLLDGAKPASALLLGPRN